MDTTETKSDVNILENINSDDNNILNKKENKNNSINKQEKNQYHLNNNNTNQSEESNHLNCNCRNHNHKHLGNIGENIIFRKKKCITSTYITIGKNPIQEIKNSLFIH